jgi:exodeoxyribonuclease VII small subunit
MADEQNFEQQMQQLEQLVTRMESGDLSLEDSLQAFEQGVTLTRNCQKLLTEAEQRVSRLQESHGQVGFEPLPGGGPIN